MMPSITIDKRFRGPPNSGNGGYVCGLIAGHIDGSAEITLRVPPPLEHGLEIVAGAGGAVDATAKRSSPRAARRRSRSRTFPRQVISKPKMRPAAHAMRVAIRCQPALYADRAARPATVCVCLLVR
jgi:hypothetical protein